MRNRKKTAYNGFFLKIGIVISLQMCSNAVNAQIIMPHMSTYDNSLDIMYLNSLREMSNYSNQLMPIFVDVYDKAANEYDHTNYQECINIISDFLNRVTIYKAQEYLCVPLYELEGKAYVKIGNMRRGIELLRRSMELNNKNAYYELDRIFQDYYNEALKAYKNEEYSLCHVYINNALSTGLQNSHIYIIEGDAYLKQGLFKESKECYKKVKKLGSPLAKDCFNRLKIAKKEYAK